MITPVRIPETPVILHRPQARLEEDSVSVDTAKTPSEKQSGLSSQTNPSGREAVVSLSQASDLEDLEAEQEVEQEVEVTEGLGGSVGDVPVATLVSTA